MTFPTMTIERRMRNRLECRYFTLVLPLGFSLLLGCQREEAPHSIAVRPTMANSIEMEFVQIPSGSFTMGSNDQLAMRCGDGPAHSVTLPNSFWIGKYEVTQAQYELIMGVNPSRFGPEGDNSSDIEGIDTSQFPVDCVSWEEATEFCRRLTELPVEKQAGRKYRLPTDAEWEYACRAESVACFSNGSTLDTSKANISGPMEGNQPVGHPTTVGSYDPNEWGLCDMHGNVAEWCQDGKREYGSTPETDPQGHPSFRPVLRGGAWDLPSDYARCERRVAALRGYVFFGFRVVCECDGAQ